MARYLYSELASLIEARRNCASNDNPWFDKHTESIEMLVSRHMPHGSGFDSGTKIDLDESHADKLVFHADFHHMNDGGYYDGWTEHVVTVTPSLQFNYHIRISGRNRNEIKDLIHQSFDVALSTDVTYDLFIERYPEFAITSQWEDKDGQKSQCYQAWYVNGERFWNDYQSARNRAAQLMEAKFYAR